MLQNLADDLGLGNETDDPHFAAAFRTAQGINLPHLFDAFPPLG